MACRRFDAQVVHSQIDTPRGQLLSQYVRVRITDLSGIDIGLFDFDGHNAVYYFVMNAEEQIYLRYGGRDATGPESYLDLESFELALSLGLEQHKSFVEGELPRKPRPTPRFPRDIPLVRERVIKWDRCVECHIVADYELQEKERSGVLDRVRTMFVYPDIRRIGIHLDVPRGLVVERATDSALAAGMLPQDLITHLESTRVLTFADLQYEYNKVDRAAKKLSIRVQRGDQSILLNLDLPAEWWWTDLYHRYWSVEPLVYFRNRPLSRKEKEALKLDVEGFASEITEVENPASALGSHDLQVGDIIFEVDGVTRDPVTQSCRLHIKLNKIAGESIAVKVLRHGAVVKTVIKSQRLNFRKESE